jgi:hypothetical protein
VTNNLGATGIFMPARAKHPDQAFKVFEWYMAGEYGVERAKTGWGIPPLLSLQKLLPDGDEFNTIRKRIALDDVRYMVPTQTSPHTLDGLFFYDWENSLRALVEGAITEEQFIDRMYAELNDRMKQGRDELAK